MRELFIRLARARASTAGFCPPLRGASYRTAALVLALLSAQPALAQIAPVFSELLRQAEASPRLLIGRAAVNAAQGEALQASARPNPTLGLEIENIAGQSSYRGFDRAESTFAVQQPLEMPSKRAARIDAALAQVTAAEARSRLTRSELAHELALAYAAAEAALARSAIALEALALAEEDSRRARQLVDNGREAEVRALQARAAASAVRADLDVARADAEVALARLSVLAGAAQPFTAIAGGLLDTPFSLSAKSTRESPQVAAARAERDAATRRIESERWRATPDVTLSLGARRFQESGSTALIAGASFPIPVFDRNRGAIATAAANANAAELRLALLTAETEAARQTAATQLSAASNRMQAAAEGEAASSEAYRLARIGYDAGRLQLLEVLNARRALIEARGRTLEARLSRVRAAADLAKAEGVTLSGGFL